jgi:predicted nucleic acid-binding protein
VSAVYLDASAFVKFIVDEPESQALHDFLAGELGRFISSALLRTEVLRAAARHGPEALGVARQGLERVDLVSIDDRILDGAGLLHPDVLRSLDAIHVATAAAIGDDLSVIVTYDERMIRAAASMGLRTATPV